MKALVFLGGQVLSDLQATGAQRAAVPQAEAVAATVLQAMAAHTDKAALQSAGCSALWSMAYQNPYNSAAMGRQGEPLTLHTHTRACVRACVRVCVCVSVCACVYACVRVCDPSMAVSYVFARAH